MNSTKNSTYFRNGNGKNSYPNYFMFMNPSINQFILKIKKY